MPYIDAQDGTKLYYKDWGEGAPVVLIHGWPLSADMWESQAPFLASQGLRVIAYDRRGFGRSDQPWSGYDYDTFADDLAAILDTLDLNGATLVGFSMGGGEVARYLGKHGSARVAKAAVISAVTPYLLQTDDNPDGVPQKVFDGMVAGIQKDRAQFFIDFAPSFYGNGLIDKKASGGVLDWFFQVAMLASPKATLDCVRAFSETDFRADLKGVTIPLLVIHGTEDKTVPIDVSARRIKGLVPSANLIEYDGEAHGLTTTAADRVNQDLLTFITG
jgi:pimeloyl-ACP methyl ester carboxylesterase